MLDEIHVSGLRATVNDMAVACTSSAKPGVPSNSRAADLDTFVRGVVLLLAERANPDSDAELNSQDDDLATLLALRWLRVFNQGRSGLELLDTPSRVLLILDAAQAGWPPAAIAFAVKFDMSSHLVRTASAQAVRQFAVNGRPLVEEHLPTVLRRRRRGRLRQAATAVPSNS